MSVVQLIIFMFVIHYLADFTLQTHDQAQGKGKGKSFWNKMLFYHVGVYTLIWTIMYSTLPIPKEMIDVPIHVRLIIFALFIFIPHYITDWLTSRIGKVFWEKQDFHNGFNVIGFDQIIHYLCLLWTFHVFKLL